MVVHMVADTPHGQFIYDYTMPYMAVFAMDVVHSPDGTISGKQDSTLGFSSTLNGDISGNSANFTVISQENDVGIAQTLTENYSAVISETTLGMSNISGTVSGTFYQELTNVVGHSVATGSFSTTFQGTIIRTALETIILLGPEGETTERSASFAWYATGGKGGIDGYYYQLDSGAKIFTTETSVVIDNLSYGEHNFNVAAKDKSENVDSTPAVRNFTVVRETPTRPERPPEAELGKPADPQKSAGDPINSVTGNMYLISLDLAIPGRGLNFEFSRAYNSQAKETGPLGYGWMHSYNLTVAEDPVEELATVKDEQGRAYLFAAEEGGTYLSQIGEHSELKKDSTGFTWRKKDGKEYCFDLSGKLLSIKDRNANTITLSYDAQGRLAKVTDTVGREITFTYDTQNRLIRMSAPLSRHYDYGYDAADNLASITDPQGNVTRYEYDSNHNLTKKTDALGNSVYFTYDASDRCLSSSGENNSGRATLTYDPDNKKTTITDSKSNTTTQYYNDDLMVVRVINPQGKEVLSTWDSDFNLLSRTDELGRVTLMEYDLDGNLAKVTDAKGQSTFFSYEPLFNLLASATDAQGNLTAYNYDTHGNLLEVKDSLANSTTYTYNAFGQPMSLTNALGKVTSFTYDSQGNLLTLKDALLNTSGFTYDALGNLIQTKDSLGNITKFAYNELNQLRQVTYPDDSTVSYAYDASGNRSTVTDANSRTTTYSYDQGHRVISTTDPAGSKIEYAYDTEGNLTAVTDQKGNETTYSYDSFNRLASETNALGLATEYEYDSVGNRTKKTDPKGKTINYEYDSLNRLTKIIYPESNVLYTYDSLGRRSSFTDAQGTTNYTYDKLSRLTKVDGPKDNDTVEYTYDSLANRLTMADPEGKLTRYSYDDLGRLSSLTDPQGKVTSYSYDALSNLSTLNLANGTQTLYTYDSLRRLLTLTNQKTASPAEILSSFSYTYDPAGRKTTTELPQGRLEYSYDAQGQLIREAKTGSANPYEINYSYDPAGNRATMQKGAFTHTYLYNALNQLIEEGIGSSAPRTISLTVKGKATSKFGIKSLTLNGIAAVLTGEDFSCPITLSEGANTITVVALGNNGASSEKSISVTYAPTKKITYTYDANGNLIKKERPGKLETFTYDPENRLIKVNTPNKELTYQYDGEGKRIATNDVVASVNTNYLYDGLNVILERDNTGATISSYIRNPQAAGGIGGIIKEVPVGLPGLSEAYYHYDGQGNVNSITDATSAMIMSVDYDAFGNITARSGYADNDWKFSTKQFSPTTGLSYFGARYYDPRLGRFITQDPSGMVDGPNVYAYCGSDPVNLIDPDGLKAYIGGRSVLGVGGHTAIILEVETSEEYYFKNDKRFIRNPYTGKLECDLSAGPIKSMLTAYPTDTDRKGTVAVYFKPINDPRGRSDIQLFSDILNSAAKYENNLFYDPFALGGCYNSNSYTRGILGDAGINNPLLPNKLFYPGWTKPITLKDQGK